MSLYFKHEQFCSRAIKDLYSHYNKGYYIKQEHEK